MLFHVIHFLHDQPSLNECLYKFVDKVLSAEWNAKNGKLLIGLLCWQAC